MRGGVDLAARAPLFGWGSGSFRDEYRAHEHASSREATSASHTIPITVAAEQGVIGLAAYIALLVLAFRRLLRGAWRVAGPCRDRRRLRGARAPHLAVRCLPRGPDDVDACSRVGTALAAPAARSERDEEDTISQNGHRREPVVVRARCRDEPG